MLATMDAPAGRNSAVRVSSDPGRATAGRPARAYDPARLRRASTRAVKRMGPNQFAVQGTHQRAYFVDLESDPPCYCKDYEYRGRRTPCLHVLAARLASGDMALIQDLGAMLLKAEQRNDELSRSPKD